ncbi:sulfotransferase domain-containing protein [Knoellia sp. CPCC 206453]|uniref:sulfotransferase domain-containing protein n=1 Tax=Knoellia pratensis TaxID=3404796 RepID=UPI00360633DD
MSRGDLLARWSAPPVAPESTPRYVLRKVLRHAYWARTEGIGRLVEEDRLDPRERVGSALRKALWRRRSGGLPGSTRPVYVVGLQRSGTNMLLRGLDAAPQIEARGENDRELFERFRLRDRDTLAAAVRRSRHHLVLIKPICDSHRVDLLLDDPLLPHGRALWVVRDVVERARSEVSKFGPANLIALRDIAAGRGELRWQGERLPSASVELVRSFDTESMTSHTAAALFWVVRNQLVFDLGLDARDDVLLVSYDAFAADPESEMRRICTFLDFPFRPELCAHVTRRSTHGHKPLDIDPRVLALAHGLEKRLTRLREQQGMAS